MAKAIWLQSGDDESITVNIATEDFNLDFTQVDYYWELRPILGSEAILSKTTYGSELLPPGTTPDITVNISNVEVSVTIFVSEYDSQDLYGEYQQYLFVRNKSTNKKTSLLYGTIGFLENPDTPWEPVYYTTPELVARQLRMTNSDGSNLIFSEDSDPARSLVITYIQQAEMRFDRETRNSWRVNYVTNEMHDISMPLAGLPLRDVVVNLHKANILPWDSEQGDSLKVLKESQWVDYTADAQEVMGRSWWIDYNIGQVHFNDFWPWFFSGANRIMISYRWGNVANPVPADIQEAVTKMVSIRLLQSEFNKIMLFNRSSNPINWDRVTQEWEKDIKEIMATRRRKMLSVVTR